MTAEWKRAVQSGDIATLDRLVREGADVNALDRHGQTALMISARDGRHDVVTFLLSHTPNLNHSAKYGLTAVMLATLNHHVDIVRALVAAGADLTRTGSGPFQGQTALDFAISAGRHDMADLLRPHV